jgi:hypothetical protein
MFLVFIFCTCFLLTDTFAFIYNPNSNNLNHNIFNKRQGKIETSTTFYSVLNFFFSFPLAVASRECGGQNNSISICSPTYDSIWTNDTDQEITWKYK